MNIKNEPVASGAAVLTGLVVATLALIQAFGIEVTPDQYKAILGAVAALIAAAGWWVRRRVDSPATVRRKIVRGLRKPIPKDGDDIEAIVDKINRADRADQIAGMPAPVAASKSNLRKR